MKNFFRNDVGNFPLLYKVVVFGTAAKNTIKIFDMVTKYCFHERFDTFTSKRLLLFLLHFSLRSI